MAQAAGERLWHSEFFVHRPQSLFDMSTAEEAVPQAPQEVGTSLQGVLQGCGDVIVYCMAARAHAIGQPSVRDPGASMPPQDGAPEAQQPASGPADGEEGAPVAMSKSQMKKLRKRQL